MRFGKFIAYCSHCGKQVETTCDGFGMWRVAGKWMVCGKECHEHLSLIDTRSIMGKDTGLQEARRD